MEVLRIGFEYVFSDPMCIFLLIAGNLFGIIFGCIPGLTATLGIILLIPFTYGMTSVQGIVLLVSEYVGGISGGLIAACLINIPGTPSSIVTTWDGYPMAKKGKAAQALSIGVFCSLLGGTFSALALILIAPQLAKVALLFGSWEYFAVALMGLSVVVAMCSEDLTKGILGAGLGLLLASVGIDGVTGVTRLTFGHWQLLGGLNDTALMMALFAVGEILRQTRDLGQKRNKLALGKTSVLPPLKEMKDCGPAIGIGAVFGTFIGIIPSVDQNVATVLAYNQSKSISKHPELFGTGCAEGIAASETSNNAVNGGALIPLITLGIPGDMCTAALIGGLMIHGLNPGPTLYNDHPEIVGGIMVTYLCANIVMYILELGLMKGFVKLIDFKMSYLFPAIVLCCVLGVYTINNRMFDVWVMIIFGLLGYVLVEFGMDLTPVIMGFILGSLIEKHMRTGLIASNGTFAGILEAPIAMGFLTVAFLFLTIPLIRKFLRYYKRKKTAA